MAALVIFEIETGKEEKRIDVSDKPQRYIDKLRHGMMINMDLERFYVRLED